MWKSEKIVGSIKKMSYVYHLVLDYIKILVGPYVSL